MPQDGPAVPLELTGFQVAQQAVLTAPAAALLAAVDLGEEVRRATPGQLQALAAVLYERLTLSAEAAPRMTYHPREWCKAWA